PPLLGDPPGAPRHLHSFPTRRSSDLGHPPARGRTGPLPGGRSAHPASAPAPRHAVRNLGPPATPARPRPQGRRARVPAPVLRPAPGCSTAPTLPSPTSKPVALRRNTPPMAAIAPYGAFEIGRAHV